VKTSNFRLNAYNENAVSIARIDPSFYKGKRYPKLAPTYEMIREYKATLDQRKYIEEYHDYILSKLDPKVIYEELGEDAILLCYEEHDQFCHRHIVSDWLNKSLGIIVTEELSKTSIKNKKRKED
jgi:uncharacterized protein (DUF488 family)